MKNKLDPKEWAKDFETFMNVKEVTPPAHLDRQVFNFVHNDLNPKTLSIVARLGVIHVITGSLSLLICSQFGMGNAPMLFMSLGEMGCTAFCGALFLGLSTLIAGFIFSNEELRKIRKTGYSPILLLGILSLTVFLFFGADIAFSLAVIWLFGALVAGMVVTEFSIGVRKIAVRRS